MDSSRTTARRLARPARSLLGVLACASALPALASPPLVPPPATGAADVTHAAGRVSAWEGVAVSEPRPLFLAALGVAGIAYARWRGRSL